MDKKRVLIIDDEEDFLRITKLNLETTDNYEVMTSSNAKDILAYVSNFKPDVILLDLLMPGMGGLEACKRVNEDSSGRKIPIIILSALDKDEDKLKAYRQGIVDYLTKPIQADDLIAKIEKACGSK